MRQGSLFRDDNDLLSLVGPLLHGDDRLADALEPERAVLGVLEGAGGDRRWELFVEPLAVLSGDQCSTTQNKECIHDGKSGERMVSEDVNSEWNATHLVVEAPDDEPAHAELLRDDVHEVLDGVRLGVVPADHPAFLAEPTTYERVGYTYQTIEMPGRDTHDEPRMPVRSVQCGFQRRTADVVPEPVITHQHTTGRSTKEGWEMDTHTSMPPSRSSTLCVSSPL